MRTKNSSQVRQNTSGVLGCALAASGLALLLQSTPAAAAATGVACTTSSSPNASFTLDARPGYIQLPDGNTMYMWGYGVSGGAFQYPGPVLCVNQGDTVTIVLHNTLAAPVSIMFPGQDNVLADGAPAQPQFDGANVLTSLTNSAAAGGSVTYSFVAGAPGTYVYESGTDPAHQVRMGLFGALVVRPAGETATNHHLSARADSAYTDGEEFMVLLSEIDPYLNQAVEQGLPYSLTDYQARYWLINGRGFPDSISDNYSAFLPDQPYGALARVHPLSASHPLPGAIRYLNVGTEEFPFHPHGQNGRVVSRDGSPLETPAAVPGTGGDLSFEKFAINIGPGQTWDVTFGWKDAESYTPANFPVVIPQVNNQEFGMFYSGSPFLGCQGALPPGASTLNESGEYYIISHNHALYQITSWGVNLTGPITYLRVDPTPGTTVACQ